MKKLLFIILIGSIISSSCSRFKQEQRSETEISELRKGFKIPPLDAKPRALWDWVDGNFSLDEITHEMEEAKAKGIGGFDIWDVRKVVDEDNIVPAGPSFMSDEYMVGIVHAINEAERLDFDLGLIISSGWNAGGIWTKPEHQTMGLFKTEKVIESKGEKLKFKMDFPVLPDKKNNNERIVKTFLPRKENGVPEYFVEIKVLAIPITKDSSAIKKVDVIDISDKMDTKGNIEWNVPEGLWKIYRFVCANTGQSMISSTPNSGGPMIDHFNPEATKEHINFFIDKLENKLGKPVGQSGLKYLYTDSYEVQGLLWTEKLLETFETQMEYSMVPFLPVFEGKIIETKEITNRFLYDYRKVWSDLIIKSHYKKAEEICKEHGIGFVAEAAGPGKPFHNCPFESIKASGSLSFPRGEFWHVSKKNGSYSKFSKDRKDKYLNGLQVIKGVSSASHLYGQKYVEAEAFTGTHLWSEGPGDLKPTADRAFTEGLNRIIFHTWPHTPKEAGKPGWAYAFGTLMNENRVWWSMAKPWMNYLGRTSFMLQQGDFVGDILQFYGDSVPNFAPAKKYDINRGFGYDYDVSNTEILLQLEVNNGDLTLLNGQKYEVLVLPDENYMVYDVLKKISELVENGATVIGRKPTKSNGLKNWIEHDKRVIDLANKVWGNCDGENIKEHSYGKGKVVWGKPVNIVLKEMNVIPDFDFKGNVENKQLDYIHRKTELSDIYFIRNTSDKMVYGEAQFRITKKQPEFWNPVSAKTNKIKVYKKDVEKTTVPISLKPEESIFIVFTDDIISNPINKILKDDKQIFPSDDNKENYFSLDNSSSESRILFNQSGKYELFSTEGSAINLEIDKNPKPINITGSWKVYFPEEEKGVGNIVFDELYSWHKSDINDIKFFSGIATYENNFLIPEGVEIPLLKTTLDLGIVLDVAHVYINGNDAGISWSKPNIIDISKFIIKGNNTIKIEVANTWHNRLCGDGRLPENERITKSNVTRLPDAWSYPMKEIPIDDGKDNYDLLESGLLGPVNIVFKYQYQSN